MIKLDHEIFDVGEPITGQSALECIRLLARKALWLKLTRVAIGQDEPAETLGLAIDSVISEDWLVEVDHPLAGDNKPPVYETGEPLFLFWSDAGIRYGVRATVTQIYSHDMRASYMLKLERNIYVLPEKRNAIRVPVSVHDHVAAFLVLDNGSTVIIPVSIEDISTSGARLLIPLEGVTNSLLEAERTGTLSVSLPNSSAIVKTPITLVWLRQFSPAHIVTGCTWPNASDAFVRAVRGFISRKVASRETLNADGKSGERFF